MKKVTVRVPATSANLGPGFDVLGIALHFYNEITLEAGSNGWTTAHALTPAVSIHVQGEGAESLPRDASNLVVRSAMTVFNKIRRWPRALTVSLTNRIPLSRGLGSSAAATIGGICAAHALLGRRLPEQELLDLATRLEGHPDNIVPAYAGGLCVSGVIHQKTQYLKFPAPAGLRAVVCSPDRALATSEARRVLPSRIPFSAAVFTSSRVAFLLGAFVQRRYEWLDFAMEDVLHQPARARLIPGLKDAIREARAAGAFGAALSGAGSSVIAFTKRGPAARRAGQAMEKAFAAHHVHSSTMDLALENKGIRYL